MNSGQTNVFGNVFVSQKDWTRILCTGVYRSFHYDWVLKTKLPSFIIGTVIDPPTVSALQQDFRNVSYLGCFDFDMLIFYIDVAGKRI